MHQIEKNVLNLQANYIRELNKYYNKKLVLFTFFSTQPKYKEVLLNFSKTRSGIFFYDGTPHIYIDQENYLNDKHPTEKGYKVIVNNLFDYLTKNKLIPCKN